MKVLLIFPPQKRNVTTGSPGIILEKAGAYPPLGLLHIASKVIQQGKHEIKILDTIVEDMSYQDIEKYVEREKPYLVGITCNSFYLYDAVMVARIVKKINPETITVAGGPHVQLYPEETIRLKEFDYALCGESDLAFLSFLDAVSAHNIPDNFPGLATKTNMGKQIKHLSIPDMDSLSIPDRRYLPYKKYKSIITKGSPITTMMSSRGCPYNCSFCPAGKTKIRFYSPDKVIEEISDCLSLGIKDILFFDELFTFNYRRVMDICDRIISQGLDPRWHIRARVHGIDKPLLEKLKKGGCQLIQFGIESGTERVQKILGKNLDLKEVEEVVKMCREEGILTYGNFMLGSPEETRTEIEKTIEFAIKLNLDFAVFSATILLPGTDFYERSLRENIISTDFWQEHINNPENRIENLHWPVDFSVEELDKICRNAYKKFFLRPKYILNYLSRVATPKQIFFQLKAATSIFYRFFKK